MLLPFLFILSVRSDMPGDIPADEPAYSAVKYLYSKGVLHTYPDGLYKGARLASRYEAAWMINGIQDSMTLNDQSLHKPEPLPDVPETGGDKTGLTELYAALKHLSSMRILQLSKDGLFHGDRAISKGELAVMGYRLASKATTLPIEGVSQTVIPEKDGKIPDNALVGIDPAELATALKGLSFLKVLPLESDGFYESGRPATRYQVAIVIARIAQVPKS